MEFARLVREARQKDYKSARKFFSESNISCSYANYARIENGALPDTPLAIEILKYLNLNTRTGLYALVRDQMPDAETKAMFLEIGDQPPRSSNQDSPVRSLVVNRMQTKLLKSDSIYWELVTYLSTFDGFKKFLDRELARIFKTPISEIRSRLRELYDYGLIEQDEENRYYTKEWIFVPFEKEFEDLRDFNFGNAAKKFLKSKDGSKFRTTVTRLLTPKQRAELEGIVRAFTNSVVDIDQVEDPATARPCTIGVFYSERRFGNA